MSRRSGSRRGDDVSAAERPVSLRMQAFVTVKDLSFVHFPHDQSVSSGICCISITLQPRSGPVDGLCCSFVTARVTSTVGSIRFQNQSADGRT